MKNTAINHERREQAFTLRKWVLTANLVRLSQILYWLRKWRPSSATDCTDYISQILSMRFLVLLSNSCPENQTKSKRDRHVPMGLHPQLSMVRQVGIQLFLGFLDTLYPSSITQTPEISPYFVDGLPLFQTSCRAGLLRYSGEHGWKNGKEEKVVQLGDP